MTIRILPARLANQIAAGEVVERPASVVKELLENCLDAGATKVEVEVIKGGHKRVLVRDNGSGIAKDQLTLALSRHATSKIATLEDLENIGSLGFRGEALASISSVSRLTITSRPQNQNEAWQAHAEGRDMDVQINPAAHPPGTSVDVMDLFFNTPARRKFLRTEKTEFAHIDELFKRAALSHYGVHFVLKHNDKVVRNYPAANQAQGKLKRVIQICGRGFKDYALQFKSEYQDIRFAGWLCDNQGARAQNDQQYCYINGRMMRDKLIAHAIRQAYEGLIEPSSYPAYVVYLTMPTEALDVNVHPTKQEVRFHQARLVHDLIYKTVNDALQQHLSQLVAASSHEDSFENPSESECLLANEHAGNKPVEQVEERSLVYDSQQPVPAATVGETDPGKESSYSENLNSTEGQSHPGSNSESVNEVSRESANEIKSDLNNAFHQPSQQSQPAFSKSYQDLQSDTAAHNYIKPLQPADSGAGGRTSGKIAGDRYQSGVSQRASNNYQQLMQAPNLTQAQQPETHETQLMAQQSTDRTSGNALCMPVDDKNMLVKFSGQFWMLPVFVLQRLYLEATFSEGMPVAQPLLMPVAIAADRALLDSFHLKKKLFTKLNIEIVQNNTKLMVRKVPAGFRQLNWSGLLQAILDSEWLESETDEALSAYRLFAEQIVDESRVFGESEQVNLWHWACGWLNEDAPLDLQLTNCRNVDMKKWLACYE